jgi:hypothetical protein
MDVKKEEIHMKKKSWLILFVSMIVTLILTACGNETTTTKEEPKKEETKVEKEESKKDTASYNADNAFVWLNESGLVSGEGENVTDKFKGSEGLVKAIKTDEADIMEFKTEEQAKKYHNPALNSYAVKNIYILIKKGQDNADNFVKVLESGKSLTDLTTVDSSDAQKAFVEMTQTKPDFVTYVDGFYGLPKKERGSTFDTYVIDKKVTWSGTIADFLSDSVIVYGKSEGYNGEDWTTISTEKKEMMPYTFIAELKDKSQLKDLKKGDTVTVKAVIGSRGDKDMQYNWKLYEGEIVK